MYAYVQCCSVVSCLQVCVALCWMPESQPEAAECACVPIRATILASLHMCLAGHPSCTCSYPNQLQASPCTGWASSSPTVQWQAQLAACLRARVLVSISAPAPAPAPVPACCLLPPGAEVVVASCTVGAVDRQMPQQGQRSG